MQFYLIDPASDLGEAHPISESEFTTLQLARSRLSAALSLEEAYNLLLANHKDLEVEAMTIAIDRMTGISGSEYQDFFEVRSSLNRRALNLLSAARLYLDQFQQRLNDAGADPSTAKAEQRLAYESSFEYRLMEALRNHVQHVGLAVHSVSFSSRRLSLAEGSQIEIEVTAETLRSALSQDPKFKKSVLAECPDKVSVLGAARAYVGGISSIHSTVRELIEPLVADARSEFKAAISKHTATSSKVGLMAIAQDGQNPTEEFPVFLAWDDVRLRMVARNSIIANLARRSFSSKTNLR
ncbi:MAG: hypothetical protein C4K60_06915 [Ideonella sp. MAG2]|nr:MAG: hypothetical protein C4K60_06915 [Ideonella sp. MAG2]